MSKKVIIESQQRVFDDFFKVDLANVLVEGYDAKMRGPMRRLVFQRGDSVAALILDRDRGDLLLVEQFRYPTYKKGPGWIIETMAGILEEGETPEEALRREMQEEVGYDTTDYEHIATYYPSPGGSSERVFLYYAEVGVENRIGSGGGKESEQEDIKIIRMPVSDFTRKLKNGVFTDSKILVAGFWFISQKHS